MGKVVADNCIVKDRYLYLISICNLTFVTLNSFLFKLSVELQTIGIGMFQSRIVSNDRYNLSQWI